MTKHKRSISINTDAGRKELVKILSEVAGCEAKYKGAPSFDYEVGNITIDKDGIFIFDEKYNKLIDRFLDTLYEKGLVSDDSEEVDRLTPKKEDIKLEFEYPQTEVNVDNLSNLVASKGELIMEALCVDIIVLPFNDDPAAFIWLTDVEPCDAKAYKEFTDALCAFTMRQKRVNVVTTEIKNPKYTFRCFLLRLGFIGDEYKETRKILLRNLEGSSAFKNGRKNEVQ